MIIYRKAKAKDIEKLAEIRSEFLMEANAMESQIERAQMQECCEAYFREAFADKSFASWLALDKEEIIATSGICFYRIPPNRSCPNGQIAYIQNMYTKPAYRRKGIAWQLFCKTVDEAKERSCSKILLSATDKGRPLYEKFGFEALSNEMVYHIKRQ